MILKEETLHSGKKAKQGEEAKKYYCDREAEKVRNS